MRLQVEAIMLHEQARVLRTLASVADHPIIKGDLLRLSEKCEALACAELISANTNAGDGREDLIVTERI